MNEVEILQKLDEIFREVLERNDIHLKMETTAPQVRGWDSLAHLTLIAEVEAAFDVKFAMKDVLGMKCVGDMVALIQRQS